MEGSDKLLKLSVDFGEEKRTVVSGIKFYYTKEELTGKKAAFVFNLAPAKIAGIESQAMILGAVNNENKYRIFMIDDSVKAVKIPENQRCALVSGKPAGKSYGQNVG